MQPDTDEPYVPPKAADSSTAATPPFPRAAFGIFALLPTVLTVSLVLVRSEGLAVSAFFSSFPCALIAAVIYGAHRSKAGRPYLLISILLWLGLTVLDLAVAFAGCTAAVPLNFH
jgi:hypothetical protein